jgi:hypothetical protein
MRLAEMSAERGWIGDPQPPKEWHTPGWVKTGGRHFVHFRKAGHVPVRSIQPSTGVP